MFNINIAFDKSPLAASVTIPKINAGDHPRAPKPQNPIQVSQINLKENSKL